VPGFLRLGLLLSVGTTADQVKDITLIITVAATGILFVATVILFTKKGRGVLIGAVLDGIGADKDHARRLYESVLNVDKDRGEILASTLAGLNADPKHAGRVYDLMMQMDKDRGLITHAVIHGLIDDDNSATKLLDIIVLELRRKPRKDLAELFAEDAFKQAERIMKMTRETFDLIADRHTPPSKEPK
jgi:hypothetical protein